MQIYVTKIVQLVCCTRDSDKFQTPSAFHRIIKSNQIRTVLRVYFRVNNLIGLKAFVWANVTLTSSVAYLPSTHRISSLMTLFFFVTTRDTSYSNGISLFALFVALHFLFYFSVSDVNKCVSIKVNK